jgi:hypothetical protein
MMIRHMFRRDVRWRTIESIVQLLGTFSGRASRNSQSCFLEINHNIFQATTMVLKLFFLNFFLQSVAVDAFVVGTRGNGPFLSILTTSKFETSLAASVEDKKAIQCFIVNAFEVEEEGVEPEIVCTPEPDDYAWFNGLERENMKPANTVTASGDFLECKEGAAPRGVPEWECKKKKVEESSWH